AYDQPTDIAQPKLAGDFIRRLQVCLQNCFLHIAPALVPASIHINRYQRFGLVDYNIAATLQPNLPVKSVVNLFLHAVSLKNRRRTIVKIDRKSTRLNSSHDQTSYILTLSLHDALPI